MPMVFVLIWSTGFIVARYGMPQSPPMSFLAVRYTLSILCFLPWIWLAGVRWPTSRQQFLHLSITGILMHAGYLGGVWAAVKAGMGSGLSSLIVGLLMFYLLGRPLAAITSGLTNWLNGLGGGSVIILGIILGLMMCFDLGGPVNKAAYAFATAGLSISEPRSLQIMAAVMAASVPTPSAWESQWARTRRSSWTLPPAVWPRARCGWPITKEERCRRAT